VVAPFDVAAGASACAWLYLAVAHGQFWRIRPLLLPPASASRRVLAVIPARDEAESIEATIRSLVGQVSRVIVVDDNSSDDTAALARNAGAEVLHGRPLQPGWTGKLWALRQGVEAAVAEQPDFLLFTDADIVHDPGNVASLVSKAERDHFDLVSLMVHLRCVSFAERLTIPAFVFFFFQLYPPRWIADRSRSTAGAGGGCVLIRPEALQRAGGVQAIRSELIDDCALARAVKRSGGSVWLGTTNTTVSTRAYPRFGDVGSMISRTAFTQLRYSPALLAGTILGMLFLYVVPVVGTLAGSAVAAAGWLIMAAIYMPTLRFYGQPAASAMLLPFTALFYLSATVQSAIRYWTGRGGTWKGRNQAAAAYRNVR
jgi:hopene-associated glycosyltransferase HpnB